MAGCNFWKNKLHEDQSDEKTNWQKPRQKLGKRKCKWHRDPRIKTQMTRRLKWQEDPSGKKTQVARRPKWQKDPNVKKTKMTRRSK